MRPYRRIQVLMLTAALGGAVMQESFARAAELPGGFDPPAIGTLPYLTTMQPPATTPQPPVRPTTPPVTPVTPNAPLETAPVTNAFNQAPQAGTTAASNFTPYMIGDLPGFALPKGATLTATKNGGFVITSTRAALIPLYARGAFKISENESPRPIDRIFIGYNYFHNVGYPGVQQFDLHREVPGFEKTFLDGDASFGMRFNCFQTTGTGGLSFLGSDFGDITMIAKYALINDRETGNVLSGGLAVSAPTGPDVTLIDGTRLNPWLLQPFTGFIYNMDRLYAHGFSSLVIPTAWKDAVFASTSLGLGYRLYTATESDSVLSSLTPTVEGHLTTPLTKRGSTRPVVGYPDVFDVTSGVIIGLGQRSSLTTAIVTPLTGPKPFDFEAVVQFNFRF